MSTIRMRSCADRFFVVPWLDQSDWSSGVLLAHRVFGALTFGLLVTWCVLFLELCTLRRAYLCAGLATCACGLWLALWVLLLLKWSASLEAHVAFMMDDLAQLQHLAIATLLLAAGATEVMFSGILSIWSRRQADSLWWPHCTWGLSIGWIGLLFTTHPQHTESETSWHLKLGLSLICGSALLTREKVRAQLDEDQSICEAPGSLLAAGSFGIATFLLCTFPAPSPWMGDAGLPAASELHVGVGGSCEPGYPLALAGLCGSMASLALTTGEGCRILRRARRGSLASREESAPAAIELQHEWQGSHTPVGIEGVAPHQRVQLHGLLFKGFDRITRSLACATLCVATYGILLPAMLVVAVVARTARSLAMLWRGLTLACASGRNRLRAPGERRQGTTCTRSIAHSHVRRLRHEPLASYDRPWLADTPSQPMVIHALLLLAPPPVPLERLQSLVTTRILSHPDMWRFLCVLAPDPTSATGYSWVADDGFDVARHVTRVPPAEAPCGMQQLQEWMSRLASRADSLPRDQPLWALQLIDECVDGGSALVFRCHHVVGDGIAMSGLLLETLMDPPLSQQGPSEGVKGQVDAQIQSGASTARGIEHRLEACGISRQRHTASLVRLARNLFELPHQLFQVLASGEDYNALHGLWSLSGTRHLAWSEAIPLAAIKQVKLAFGCSVNDVLLSATTAALSRYLARTTDLVTADDAVPSLPHRVRQQLQRAATSRLTLGVPVNMRSAAQTALTNQFAVAFVTVPLAADSPRTRLTQTVQAMDQLKRSSAPFAMWWSLRVVSSLLPASLAAVLIDVVADGATAIVTNNRGPDGMLFFDGRCCTQWVSWAPTRASVGICVTVYTYAGTVRCSVSADDASVPDVGLLVSLITEELEVLAELAGWTGPLRVQTVSGCESRCP